MSLFHLITHQFKHSSYIPPHYHPSILISSYVIIPSYHPSVQPFIPHTTSLSPIHSDIILCHYSIPSPICSTIHPTQPHYHPSILISSYVNPSHHPSIQPFIQHTTSLSPIHFDIILCHYSIPSPICSTIHSSYTPPHFHPSILISTYVIIASLHPSIQPFILHTTLLSPIHSDIILCHYSISSPICSTIHPPHHLTITHPF